MYRRYSIGDVVLVHYPYIDKNGHRCTKVRPAVVLDLDGDDHYIVQCTSKNRSDKLLGIWVLKESPEGIKMRISENTFINATETITLKPCFFIRKIGDCPFIDRLKDMITPE